MVTVVTCVVNRPTQFWQAYVLFNLEAWPEQLIQHRSARCYSIYLSKKVKTWLIYKCKNIAVFYTCGWYSLKDEKQDLGKKKCEQLYFAHHLAIFSTTVYHTRHAGKKTAVSSVGLIEMFFTTHINVWIYVF